MSRRDEAGRWAPSLRGSILIIAVTLAAAGVLVVPPFEGIFEGARDLAVYMAGIGIVAWAVAYLAGIIRH